MLLPTSCGPGRPPNIRSSLIVNQETGTELNSLNKSIDFNCKSEKLRNYKNDKLMTITGKQQYRKRTNKIFYNLRNLSNSLNWFLIIFTFLIVFVWSGNGGVKAEKSKHYYMQSLCKNHFLQQLYRKIDGAVLWSQNERNLDCVITFQTHSILQRFMLRFDLLQLDCNDHLYIYDGAHAVGAHKADLSCRNTKQSVGSIFTRTNFVTLKYVTDGWGTDANGFKLVITAVKDSKHTCKDFRCTLREFCIHPDLVCDNVNHCGDNSDETASNSCQKDDADDATSTINNIENNENENVMTDTETTLWNFIFKIISSIPKIIDQESSTLMGLELTWFVLVAVSSLLIICACIVGISICLCRRNANTNQNTSVQLRQTAETNGSSKHLHHHGNTLPREQTSLPNSGNWHHPAGLSEGYHRIQHILLMMATKVRPIWCLANFAN